MRSKRFLILTVSLLLLAFPVYKIVLACSDGPDPYDYYPQFFPPSATAQPSFLPFQYTAEIKYYDDWYSYTSVDEVPDANLAAWSGFAGNSVATAELDSFIYKFSWAQLNQLYKNIDKGTALPENKIASNGFSKYLKQKKDLETLGYLMYAKQCEPYVAGGDGDWELPASDTAKMSRLQKNGQQLYAVCKQDFIKERFAFQVLRMAFHEQKYAEVLALYSAMIGDEKKEGSDIFLRSLAIKAGTLFRLERKPEAAYLFSLVFDKSANQRRSSFISFDWATGKDVQNVLPLCKNNHERAVLQVMDGLRIFDEALPHIKAAYAADPNVNGLDVLVTREINKIEERYQQDELLKQRNLSSNYQYYNQYSGSSDKGQGNQRQNRWKDYAKQVNDFCLKAATDEKNMHQAFWHLTSAYLYFVQGDLVNSKHYLEVATQDKMSNREHDLHDVIKTLLLIRGADKMNAATESTLLPLLRWMDERGAKNPDFDKTYRDLMSTVLTNAYLHSGDTTKAIFCLARVTRGEEGRFSADPDFMDLPGALLEQLSPQRVKTVRVFLIKKAKTEFEAWLMNGTPYTPECLIDLEGTKYLRMQQFAPAASALSEASKDMQAQVIPNPFVAHVKDVMDLGSGDTIRYYSKLEFARRMAELSGKNDAQSLFEYGEGLYSMSYYGKAHHASDYFRSSVDERAYYSNPNQQGKAEPEYYSVRLAEQTFVQAAAKTNDAELKAKCNWMAAKCWQKRCPTPKSVPSWEREDDKTYYRNALKNPYFKAFLEQSRQTTYSAEVLNTCDYLKDYMRQK